MSDDTYISKGNRGWHVDKTVSYGHILTTVSLLFSLFYYITSFDTRIEVMRTELVNLKDQQARDRASTTENLVEIKQLLRRIEDRLNNGGK